MKLALGTVQFGMHYGITNGNCKTARCDAHNILECALKNNISMIDTAANYGDSERVLGTFGMKPFSVVTKLPSEIIGNEHNWVKKNFKISLNNLKVSKVYGLLLHRSDHISSKSKAGVIRALRELKDDGLVSKIGISIYNPDELENIPKDFKIDLVQAPFNILDRRLLNSGWLDRLYDNGVEVHARSAFLQGLLLTEPKKIPSFFTPWAPLFEEWRSWLNHNKISAAEACLAFLNNHKISYVVFGALNIEQFTEILEASRVSYLGDFPNIACNDKNLINPSYWKTT